MPTAFTVFVTFLLYFPSIGQAQIPDLDMSQMYEQCVQDVLQKATTGAEVKANLPKCEDHSSNNMFPYLSIMERQVKGWCMAKASPCADTEVCAPVLGERACPKPTDDCDTGLVASGGKCVCPGTTKVATAASECTVPPTPTPPTCGLGLQAKNGKCVCPGTATVATAAARCKMPGPLVSPQQVTQDTQRLDDLTSRADLCCHNPSACGAPDTTDLSSLQPREGQGIGDFCNSLQRAGQMNADSNAKAAEVCQASYMACTSEARAKLSMYQDFSDQCDGECDSSSLIESALSRLQRAMNTCNSFATLVRAMGRQQIASGTAAGQSSFCAQSANHSADTQQSNFNLNYCMQNPKAPGCPAQLQAAQELEKGKDGYRTGKIDKPNFNPNEINDVSGFKGDASGDQNNQQAAHTIPGGSAYNAGGNPTQAKLDPRAPTATGPGANTDIMQGNLAGGYAQSPGDPSNAQYGSRFAPASANAAGAGNKNIDLKPWLMPPNRRFPAGMQMQSGVLGKWDDIWQHIRDRMQLKCKLGVLQGCPGT